MSAAAPLSWVRVAHAADVARWREWLHGWGFDLDALGPRIVEMPGELYRLPFRSPPPARNWRDRELVWRYLAELGPTEIAEDCRARIGERSA